MCIRDSIKAVRRYLPLANDCEITYEGRLSGFGTDKMEAALAGGANRFSFVGPETGQTALVSDFTVVGERKRCV